VEPDAEEIVRDFHRYVYDTPVNGWMGALWLGTPTFKNPLDFWIYQELIHRLKPDVIVETGTARGGSAFFFASICDLVGNGRIITIDFRHVEGRPEHDRITYVEGSSISTDTVEAVGAAVEPGERVLVSLDSAHTKEHVLEEMKLYAPLVTKRSYLVVEDTNLGGHPARPEHGAGPMEAVEEFLAGTDEFVVDRGCEKFLMTYNPGGYLRRIG
jgi:cephalosporin hydroxylase